MPLQIFVDTVGASCRLHPPLHPLYRRKIAVASLQAANASEAAILGLIELELAPFDQIISIFRWTVLRNNVIDLQYFALAGLLALPLLAAFLHPCSRWFQGRVARAIRA